MYDYLVYNVACVLSFSAARMFVGRHCCKIYSALFARVYFRYTSDVSENCLKIQVSMIVLQAAAAAAAAEQKSLESEKSLMDMTDDKGSCYEFYGRFN